MVVGGSDAAQDGDGGDRHTDVALAHHGQRADALAVARDATVDLK